jgi:fatty acid-binding protein DegV
LQGTFTLPEKIIYAELSAGLSVHSGAGMLGFAFVVSD